MNDEMLMSAQQYYDKADEALQKKDLLDFVAKISNAELLARTEPELLPKVTFLKVKGFFRFNEHQKVLESITSALKHNNGLDWLKLKNFEGSSYGHTGNLKKAQHIFMDIINQTNDPNLLVETYLNITWATLVQYVTDGEKEFLDETKKYLELCTELFEQITDHLKTKIFINAGVYYFYVDDYEKAISQSEEALKFADEELLPSIYNNLAELYLKSDPYAVSHLVHEYGDKAEVIGIKQNNNLKVGKSFYVRALAELREDQLFTALDTLYLSFEYFKKANSLSFAFDCLVKINEIINEYKIERLKSLGDTLKRDFEETPLYKKL